MDEPALRVTKLARSPNWSQMKARCRVELDIGDKAVYPVHGVAEVVALERREIAGSATSVYVLKILETGLTIIVPTENAGAIGDPSQ